MSFTIRLAQKNDMRSVHDLIVELAEFEREPQAVVITIADLERDGFSDHPKFKVFVAEEYFSKSILPSILAENSPETKEFNAKVILGIFIFPNFFLC